MLHEDRVVFHCSVDCAAIITCKGRLGHLRLSLPSLLRATDVRVCIVDYACPDHAGDWARAQAPDRVVVERVSGEAAGPFFNKSRAQNVGARAAARLGASSFFFLDADTVVRTPLPSEQLRCRPGSCRIAARGCDGRSIPSLSGVLLVRGEDFWRVDGFDEDFECWGSEDIDLRLRLHAAGCEFETLPERTFLALPHSSRLRTVHYPEKNLRRGAIRNEQRMLERLRRMTGRELEQQSDSLRRLLF